MKEKSKKLRCARKENRSGSEAAGARQEFWRGVAVSKLVAASLFKLLCFLKAFLCFPDLRMRSTMICRNRELPEEHLGRNCSGAWYLAPRNQPRVRKPRTGSHIDLSLAWHWYMSLTISTKGHILLEIRNTVWYNCVIGSKDYVCFISFPWQISPNDETRHIQSSNSEKPHESAFHTGCSALTCPEEWTLCFKQLIIQQLHSMLLISQLISY